MAGQVTTALGTARATVPFSLLLSQLHYMREIDSHIATRVSGAFHDPIAVLPQISISRGIRDEGSQVPKLHRPQILTTVALPSFRSDPQKQEISLQGLRNRLQPVWLS